MINKFPFYLIILMLPKTLRGQFIFIKGVQEGQAPNQSKNFDVILFIVESGGMLTEKQEVYSMFGTLNMPVCRNIAMTVVAYLSQEDIEALCLAFEGLGRAAPHFFVEMIRNRRFISNYINATDKSLYFTFYEEEEYKQIEIQQIAAISQANSRLFQDYEQSFAEVTQCLKTRVPVMEQEMEMMLNMLVNPDLPLPQMKRQTQGMFCTSPFQLFLVHETFHEDMEEEEVYTCFQKLQSFLNLEQQENYLKQFMLILKDKHKGGQDLKKIMKVRYTPYEINSTNFKEYFIDNNELHNFIVGLFALTDVMLEATHEYVRMIDDPLHRMVELTLRYNIYRNFVLGVEELLPFVFRIYENIYRETIESHSKPKYRFWRPALTKWFLRMDPLHKEGQEVYMHCLTKLRITKLKEQLSELYSSDQKRFGKLLEAVEMNNFEYEFSEKISKWGNGASELSSFFDEHPENYETVVMEFNDYLVDISVNEQTVHWCGHSKHQMEEPYLEYEDAVVEMSLDFLSSLARSSGQELSKEDIFELIKVDADYISNLQIKNRTLKRMVDAMRDSYSLEQLFEQKQDEIFILGSFEEADRKLEYFNHKALILAVIDENSRPFYSIPPLCCPEKLINMIDTNASENNSEDEDIEYLSQGEEESKPVKVKRVFEKYESDEELDSPLHLNKDRQGKKPKSVKTFLLDEEEECILPTLERVEST